MQTNAVYTRADHEDYADSRRVSIRPVVDSLLRQTCFQ